MPCGFEEVLQSWMMVKNQENLRNNPAAMLL